MNNGIRHTLSATLFVIGFTLSPFTLWNDSFVNLPLTIVLSEPFIFMFETDRVLTYFIAYGFTNVLGIALMALTSARGLYDISRSFAAKYLSKGPR
jgi:hypothetical protein